MNTKISSAKKAMLIGIMCGLSYLAVCLAKNLLSAASPLILEQGVFDNRQIGTLSSAYFITYALGQLINGALGDKIRAKYMISLGLSVAGICVLLFPLLSRSAAFCYIVYGSTGFFLSMIYGPMTKVVAENIEEKYVARTSLGYTFAALFGSPLAGFFAVIFSWQAVFSAGSAVLIVMGLACFFVFHLFEKRGYVQYKTPKEQQKERGSIALLFKHSILKFTVVAVITGVIRTTVIFWLPTYLSQHLGFLPENAALIFTVCTFLVSAAPFAAVFLYERLGNNMHLSMLISFVTATLSFVGVFVIHQPIINIAFLLLGIIGACSADALMWSVYCPTLKDTGLVSGATGYLDFTSYIAAAVSSTVFANSVSAVGWDGLILIWALLMLVGVIISLPNIKKSV